MYFRMFVQMSCFARKRRNEPATYLHTPFAESTTSLILPHTLLLPRHSLVVDVCAPKFMSLGAQSILPNLLWYCLENYFDIAGRGSRKLLILMPFHGNSTFALRLRRVYGIS